MHGGETTTVPFTRPDHRVLCDPGADRVVSRIVASPDQDGTTVYQP